MQTYHRLVRKRNFLLFESLVKVTNISPNFLKTSNNTTNNRRLISSCSSSFLNNISRNSYNRPICYIGNRFIHLTSFKSSLLSKMPKYEYPKVKRDESIVDNFHGTEIKDPYRWLEDPEFEETKKFVDEQNKLTNSFLEKCSYRTKIRERITELWNYEKYGCPFKRKDYYYFYKNSGLQNQSVLYQQKTLESEPVEFVDPNKFAEDGTTSLSSSEFSDDGKLFAYMSCEKGSDWAKIKIRDVETKADHDDCLERVKFSCLSWTHDNKGFFYNQYPLEKEKAKSVDGTTIDKNEFQILSYHRIGTKQSEDVVVARFPDEPNWMGHAEVSQCGNYILLKINKSCDPVNQLWYYDLKKANYEVKENLDFVKLVPNFDSRYDYVTNDGSVFVFKTNRNAPKYKLVKIDLSEEEPKWVDLVAEKDKVLQDVNCVNEDKLVLNYMQDCKDQLYLYDLKTGKELKKFDTEIGTVLQINGEKKDDFFFYKFSSFTTPGDIYYYKFDESADIQKKEPEVYRRTDFKGLDLSEFKTEQIFYPSKDGTRVPMFLVSKKTLEKSEQTPTLMYGYGGFNISLTPTFSVSRLIWLKHFNGLYVNVNLRGGGEYGEEWYNAGRLLKKQNVFDDFIAAGEYLIENKYTSKNKLAINGGSNGGLLVTACINQRPDLFQAAIADVSVTDMFRFHKFTIGSYWVSDFGCADDPEHFKYQLTYSPLHTINKEKQYPYVLLVTADHDDRVVPSHSYKYIAELQYQNGNQEKPFLIRIDTKAGHGAGKPTSKLIEEYADKYGFLAEVMEAEWKED